MEANSTRAQLIKNTAGGSYRTKGNKAKHRDKRICHGAAANRQTRIGSTSHLLDIGEGYNDQALDHEDDDETDDECWHLVEQEAHDVRCQSQTNVE